MAIGWEMDMERLASAIPLAALARVRQPEDPINVLLVHNDGSYRRRLSSELSKRGFAVQSFADSRMLLSALGAGIDADIIVALVRGGSKVTGAEFLADGAGQHPAGKGGRFYRCSRCRSSKRWSYRARASSAIRACSAHARQEPLT